MKTAIQKILAVWDGKKGIIKEKMVFPYLNVEEIVRNVFTVGPTYHYIIDFHDRTLSHTSESIRDIHGFDPKTVTLTDILNAIHPDDINHVSKAEEYLINTFLRKTNLLIKSKSYKTSYAFRFKIADGSYKLFLHQVLHLSSDKNGNVGIALNIHTDISHITTINNYKINRIGIKGLPSYINLSYDEDTLLKVPTYTSKELEIIKMLSVGKSSQTIAGELCNSINTIKNHRKNIFKKSKCSNVAELITMCTSKGLL